MRLSILKRLFGARMIWRPIADIGMDLGTGNTLITISGRGVVLNEPSIVAMTIKDREFKAFGTEAKSMNGRTTDGVKVIHPLRDGVIADVDAAEAMIRHYLRRVMENRILRLKPRLIVGVPAGITNFERRAVRSVGAQVGARETWMVSEPLAAAIGAGLPVAEPTASMVVDMGGGTTDVAIIALYRPVSATSVRVAGHKMDEAIAQGVKKTLQMHIGLPSAEDVKIRLASAWPQADDDEQHQIKGLDSVTLTPTHKTVTRRQIREWIREPLEQVYAAIQNTLAECPPELASDLVTSGIVLTGGGAMIAGLDTAIAEKFDLPVRVDEEPLTCVTRGVGRIIERMDLYRGVLEA